MNRWSWLLVIFGCFALLLSLGDWKHIEVSPNEQPASAGEPDLYMEKAAITQYGDDGTVRYRLLSTEVRHYEDERITRLVSPTMTLYPRPSATLVCALERRPRSRHRYGGRQTGRSHSAARRRPSRAARAESHRNHRARICTCTPIANSPKPTNLLSSTPRPVAHTRSECPVISTPVSSNCRRAPLKGSIPSSCQVSSNVPRRQPETIASLLRLVDFAALRRRRRCDRVARRR